ncbi:E3 ubiquitin-protein ligase TRAIP-like isoform X1 [Dermacentor silvarum]|uniref:E3 ubiquitin-protein ligase TRAIP-like isoform X1 n=1 Tax=Dermacentor silvarum TaxID=543639 RepID=UPI0021013BCE|nr:E3 ubiquitin-protein ligase TRAIP-like isoform X1 [Dermacentor silvarum]
MKFTCSICMDNFSSENVDNITATGCGHVFHEMCLLHWTEMSKTCPACRKPLRPKQVFKLFFNVSETKEVDVGDLQNKLDDAKAQLRAANVEKIKQQEAADTLKAFLIQREEELQKFKDKYMDALGERAQLQAKIQSMRKEVSEKRQLYDENITLRSRITGYESLRKLIDSNAKEADELLKSYADGPGAIKLLATYCVLVKRQLQTVTDSRSQLNREALDLRKKVAYLEVLARERVAHIRALEGDVNHLKDMLHRAELNAERGNTSASTNAHDGPIAERQLLEMSEEFRNRMECVMGSLSAELGLHEAQLRQQAQHAQARREDADDARATLRCAEFRPRSLQQLHGNRKRLPRADEPNEPPQSVPGRAPKRPRL